MILYVVIALASRVALTCISCHRQLKSGALEVRKAKRKLFL